MKHCILTQSSGLCGLKMLVLISVLVLLCVKSVFVNADCNIVTKSEWDGLTPLRVRYLPRPVKLVIIQHTATQPCSTDADCKDIVQSIQNNHMDNLKFDDIGPNFIIGGNGKVYEGSGWLHVGAHTYGYNNRSIGISFIGNFNEDTPSQESLDAAQTLISCGVKQNHISPTYNLVAHKQLVALESPGKKIYNVMRRWPHWLENVRELKKGK